MYLVPVIAIIAAWALGALFTGLLIPFLEKKQFRQFVREVGPQSHLHKTGTPSMGGLAIIGATVITTLAVTIATKTFDMRIVVILVMMVLFGLIGFIDDYEKAIKKNNKGISPKQKIVMQFGFSLAFAIFAMMESYSAHGLVWGGEIWLPILNQYIDLGILYIPFVIFVMVAFSNSVNLTDGLDGLASGVTALVACFMIIAAVTFGFTGEPAVYGALAGACLGFLVFNRNPAKIFMGDTGSMALGGVLAAGAILMKLEFILAIAGLVYVIEALSVIIQVGYFKKTGGKRFFKMAPLHHHFELCGMSERKVVVMFYFMALAFCLIAFLVMKI
ncbi:MAG: phospho-N-acetylmuramoyl-pentapeptide-transferase [Firmicutes bacterium]|nr:phospho-N-acetylmuramoyl-pentapeptide-transferase [Bacillota bacterium]